MNLLLWVLQIFLALHTAMGAVWKFSNSEQTVPTLSALPHELWLAMIGMELLCVMGFILPIFSKRLGKGAPFAATLIAAEMLVFTGFHLAAGGTDHAPMIYWLVVAALCAFVAFGRLVLKPIRP